MYLNKQVLVNLWWVAKTMEAAMGLLFNTMEWLLSEADLIIYCDALMTGLSFYCPTLNVTYYVDITYLTPTHMIFYYKALSILSALMWAYDSTHKHH